MSYHHHRRVLQFVSVNKLFRTSCIPPRKWPLAMFQSQECPHRETLSWLSSSSTSSTTDWWSTSTTVLALASLGALGFAVTTTTTIQCETIANTDTYSSGNTIRDTTTTTTSAGNVNDQSKDEPFSLKQHYTFQKVLGQGAYGMVYQAQRTRDGKIVAVKTLSRQYTGTTSFEAEVAALQQLNGHKNIIQLYDLHRDDKNYYLVMELVDGIELYDYLVSNGPFSEATAGTFLRQCAEAIRYIHDHNLIHGDLKPENLLLTNNNTTLKLVDFGCACSHDTSRNDMLLPAEEFALGCSFLHRVALGNQFELERMLQLRPSLVNFRDYDNRTPLHLAASEGHVDICRFLINRGARVNRIDRWGGSPLDDAHRHKNTAVIHYLKEQGAKFGSTAAATRLVEAASAGDKEEVMALIEFGDIDIDKGDYDRRTALHLAAGEGRLEIVEVLCKAGANVNVKDRWGNRPIDDARHAKKNSSSIIQVLQQHGATRFPTALFSTTETSVKPKKAKGSSSGGTSSSGTIAYWPPEMFIEGARPTPATDMWAVGVIMYIILTGSHPFDKYAEKLDSQLKMDVLKCGLDQENYMEAWNESIFDDRMDGLSASSVELLRQLLHPDQKQRMKSNDFVRHPWIQGITAASSMVMDPSNSQYMKKRFRKSILRHFAKDSSTCDKSKLRDIFNAIDLEGNGVLDANEIRVALRSVGEPEDVISNIVASMDLQRDGGSVQGVSWESFQAIMNAKEE